MCEMSQCGSETRLGTQGLDQYTYRLDSFQGNRISVTRD